MIFSTQVGSFNYDNSKMVFNDEFIADETKIRSVLDYSIKVKYKTDHQQCVHNNNNISFYIYCSTEDYVLYSVHTYLCYLEDFTLSDFTIATFLYTIHGRNYYF
jgi:hypothetical protein